MLPCLSYAQYMKVTRGEHVLGFGFKFWDSQYIDGFEFYHICLTRFGLKLIIFFRNSSQLSDQVWDCKLLY